MAWSLNLLQSKSYTLTFFKVVVKCFLFHKCINSLYLRVRNFMRWIYFCKWSEYETAGLSFLTFLYYERVKNVSFSKKFAYVRHILAISLKNDRSVDALTSPANIYLFKVNNKTFKVNNKNTSTTSMVNNLKILHTLVFLLLTWNK